MKIIYIRPGTGGAFYCENCTRDHSLIAGLRTLGHDVYPVAMYLPVEEADDSGYKTPITFGAVRIYLTDQYPRLKKIPEKLLRILDSRFFLNLAAGFAGSTRAGGHEEMTISMILGEEGTFADEFDVTVDGLLKQKPDAIIIPNAFLIGIGSAVKAKSPSTKIICMLQDEHVWTDLFAPQFRDKTWETIARKLSAADKLCSHSNWYKQKVAPLINVSPNTISTVPLGVDPNKYAISSSSIRTSPQAQISIGYLSRLCGDLGVDILAEAYCLLLKNGVCGVKSTLDLCGGYTKDDAEIINCGRKSITGANGRVNIRKRFDINARSDFLSTQTVLSVPAPKSIAFGSFITEAMAAGVPAAQPDDGGFSEVIAETGAGRLYSPNTPEALAETLARIIGDGNLRKSMAAAGRKAVVGKYNHIEMARQTIAL